MTTTVELLREARSLIDTPDKWIKKEYGFPDGDGGYVKLCAWAAVTRARGPMHVVPHLAQPYAAIAEALGEKEALMKFNDHPDTTHEDIMNLFDKAIKIAEAS